MKRRIPKPFSEMTRTEQIAEAKGSIERLEHPHNRYSLECMKAAARWRELLKRLEAANPN